MSAFRFRLSGLAMVLAMATALPALAAQVRNLHLGETDGQLTLSFSVQGAFTPELQEQIESGIPVSFEHSIQSVRERRWWFNAKDDLRQVVTTVRYDALTGQYQLSREVDGQRDRDWVTRDPRDAAAWMGRVEDVPLKLTRAQAGEVTHIRVRTALYERRLLAVIPWMARTAWAQVRLALP